MKIQSINIKNFKGIRSYEGDISGKHVYLVGGNEQGKTSFIDAVWLGISGKNCPPEPITDGGARGMIEVEFEDFIARTKFKKGRPMTFELENKTFTEESEKFIKAPRGYMEKKIGILDFNINDFFNKTDAEQVKYFAKVMGEDFSDIDSQIEEIIESRKFDKKKLKEAETKTDYFDEEDAKKELVDVVELSKKIEAEREKAAAYDKIDNGVEERQKQISDLKAEIIALEAQVKAGKDWLNNPDNKVSDELDNWREELNNSTTINDTRRKNKEALAAELEANKLKRSIDEANGEIIQLKEKKAKRISDKINIDGLAYSVSEERFLWNGLPFDPKQINTAAQLISGMKIGATMLNELKILKVDASLIDKDNFDKVLEWADDENIELFVELVDREAAKLEIILQDPKEY